MPAVLQSRGQLKRIIRRRKESGSYRGDQVWDGDDVTPPGPKLQHQGLASDLVRDQKVALAGPAATRIDPTVNFSDREDRWRKKLRCPEASDFLPGHPAQDRGPHRLVGPDFAVEILKPRGPGPPQTPLLRNGQRPGRAPD